jgi:hypothetical protein
LSKIRCVKLRPQKHRPLSSSLYYGTVQEKKRGGNVYLSVCAKTKDYAAKTKKIGDVVSVKLLTGDDDWEGDLPKGRTTLEPTLEAETGLPSDIVL